MEMVVTVAHNIYAIAALQHNNRVAPHTTEFRFAQISSPMFARFSLPRVHHQYVSSDYALDLMISEDRLGH